MKFVIQDDDKIIYHAPLGKERAGNLEALLRDASCFCASFVGADPYSIETYIFQLARHRTNTVFILDRNIYSQVLALAKGKAVTRGTRVAAGIMAFASCANASIEPSLAVCEGSASGARGGWKNDLGLFHRADEIHSVNWAALALGIIERFDRTIPRRRLRRDIAKRFDPAGKLNSYDFVYPILLKMACIIRAGGTADFKMLALLDWMFEVWYFSAPATCLALRAFAQDPPKVFKNLGSHDRRQALKGVKNAAWDLVYLTEWLKRVKQQAGLSELTVLCSQDKLLLGAGELLRDSLFGQDDLSVVRRLGFSEIVQTRYAAHLSDLSNEKRKRPTQPSDSQLFLNRVVTPLEAAFLNP
jgi:hypothetical protein